MPFHQVMSRYNKYSHDSWITQNYVVYLGGLTTFIDVINQVGLSYILVMNKFNMSNQITKHFYEE